MSTWKGLMQTERCISRSPKTHQTPGNVVLYASASAWARAQTPTSYTWRRNCNIISAGNWLDQLCLCVDSIQDPSCIFIGEWPAGVVCLASPGEWEKGRHRNLAEGVSRYGSQLTFKESTIILIWHAYWSSGRLSWPTTWSYKVG